MPVLKHPLPGLVYILPLLKQVFGFINYLAYQLHYCMLLDKCYLSDGMCLYQVMVALHFLNDVANGAESKQKSTITSLSLV